MSFEQRNANMTRDPKIFTDKQLETISKFKVDENGYIPLGELCWNYLGEQTQYVAYYFHENDRDSDSYPFLAKGINFVGDDAFSIRILKEDMLSFIIALREYRWTHRLPCP